MSKHRSLLFLASLTCVSLSAMGSAAQGESPTWQRAAYQVDSSSSPNLQWLNRYQAYTLNMSALKQQLAVAPLEGFRSFENFIVIDFPKPDGSLARFKVEDSPIMTAELARRIPVKTYRIQDLNDPLAQGRIDVGPNGFHGLVVRSGGSYVIEPMKIGDMKRYVAYYRTDNDEPRNFTCFTQPSLDQTFSALSGGIGVLGAGDNRKTYRLAMNATGEYTAFFGSEANANAAVITSVNRVNTVYEIDLAIRLNLVYQKCWTNAATDPFTNNNGGTMLGQNQTNLDTTVGNANYDHGHVFSTGGGGVAGLKVVGVTGQKARGVTGLPAPVGDNFDIDYVAHEMGHQYGANHTFNGTAGSCSGNKAASAAYEPGSGSTIMAYAGICGTQNIQPHSDPYMHYKSIEEIYAWRNNAGSGGSTTSTGNLTPTVNAGADFTIPQNTPFKVTASGSDPNGGTLTYCWEQYNLGTTSTTMPIFRSRIPTTSPTRFLPRLVDVLANAATPWELLPTVDRSITMRATIRDNFAGSGGYATDTMIITVAGTAFSVTSPNTAVTWPGGSTQTVTWNVGGGSVAPNVRILLSTNGGTSYGDGTATVLLASTPNDGSQTITVPNTATTQARIIVEAVGNIFYDVSNANFTITAGGNPVPTLTSLSPSSTTKGGATFTLTANGTNFVNGSILRWNGSDRATTFVNANQVTAQILASDIVNAGTASVTVFNPAPGGGTSNALTFSINNPVPTITSISPSSATAAGAGFNLTVNGTNFVGTSVVRWNGSDRVTTFGSSTQLTAAITAADIATVGPRTVTVFNPAPGGGTSNGLTFNVNPIELAPTAFSITIGSFVSGNLATFANSDDSWYVARSPIHDARNEGKVAVEVSAPAGITAASRIDFSFESHVNKPNLSRLYQAWDYTGAGSWVTLSSSSAPLADDVVNVSLTTNVTRFLSGGPLKVRVFVSKTAVITPPITVDLRIDRIHWTVYP